MITSAPRAVFSSLISMSLRTLILAGKFVLGILIARYGSTSDLGIYGLMTAAISIGFTLVGLDFYVYSTREIAGAPPAVQACRIRDQFCFHLSTYPTALLACAVLFAIGFLPLSCLLWFYMILPLEHVAQELYRMLIALCKPTLANTALFIRSAGWIYIYAIALFLHRRPVSLQEIWRAWALGCLGGILLSLWSLRHLPWAQARTVAIDAFWIRRGLSTGLLFFAGTLAALAGSYVDRYVLNRYLGVEAVGIYTFFISISTAMANLIETGVVNFIFPQTRDRKAPGTL